MPDSHIKGYIQVAAAAVLFGLIGIFVKLVSDMQLGSIIFYRLLISLAVIAVYFAISGRFSDLRLKESKIFIVLLGLFQAATMFGFFSSIKYTTVPIAVLLLYTAPIYVALLSPIVLKERITQHGLAALILSITGVIMIIQPGAVLGEEMYGIGLVAGLVSGLAYAGMILTSRHLRHQYSGTVQAAWALFLTMVIFTPYSAVPAGVLMDNLLILCLFGLVPTVALVLYLSGLAHVRAQNASIVGLLEPASAVVFAFIILREPISSTTLIGGMLILSGAVIVSRERPVEYVHE